MGKKFVLKLIGDDFWFDLSEREAADQFEKLGIEYAPD
jgi:hypothetical protein